jgi:hypothetical protein
MTDSTPPTITGLTLSSRLIHTSRAPQTITITLHATDDLSGVAAATAFFDCATASVAAPCRASHPRPAPLEATLTGTAAFPQYGPTGRWAIRITASDQAGNLRKTYAPELAAAGMPATIATE